MHPFWHAPPVRRLLIAVTVGSLALALLGVAPAAGQPTAPRLRGDAASILPPGNSGFVSAAGQASGAAGGSYGPNLDDQSERYWGLDGYSGHGFADPADAVRVEEPADGVTIYWDSHAVPAIYADSGRDVWFGAGYAVAELRLFLMDAVRRMARGTFAELTGPSGVPADVQARVLGYTDAEYEAMFAALSDEARDAVEGYVDGANAWRERAIADPTLLPAEYALLTTVPEPFDVIDVLASGVFITRSVASEGGQEMGNVALLRELEATYGVEAGRGVFTDFVWDTDPAAAVTVPRAEGVFTGGAAGDPAAAFDAMADWAATLPLSLAEGPGTGDHPEPASLDVGAAVPTVADAGAVLTARAIAQLAAFRDSIRGGSIGVAIGPRLTAEGGAMLLSGPQLGYSYPSLLVELEVHGGGYDARGASVPALPVVGIGYTDSVAWALTTGFSKTIDSVIETVRGGGDAGPLEVLHDGEWVPADCREEVVGYREAAMGLPLTPALRSEAVEVCRTVHGPIVATEEGEGERLARAVQYHMWARELETVEGVLAWNRADDLEDFAAGVRQVTWNENAIYADADGHIAYWHPGLHLQRPEGSDPRLPLPGDGSMDLGAPLPFEALPQVVDPVQGFVANWNNSPAHGWPGGVGMGYASRPPGPVQRVVNAAELATSTDDHTLQTLADLEVEAGLRDVRAGAFLPLVLASLEGSDGRLAEVADLLEGWNRRHHDPAGAPSLYAGPGGTSVDGTDGPAPTVFDAIVDALLVELFADVPEDLVSRQRSVASHVYDASPVHNLALRVLDPTSSGLTPSMDYTGGRSAEEVVLDAVESALASLAEVHGSDDLDAYRRPTATSEVESLTGVVGPSSTQPYMDRGSYVHLVAFDPPAELAVERAWGSERIGTSVDASRLAHLDGAATVVVASAQDFPDALAAAPLAAVDGAPILLVGTTLPEVVAEEVVRLGATRAVVVGGPAAVPHAVVAGLEALDVTVERVAGPDRVATAAAVARRVGAGEGVGAYVVSGEAFADALAVGGVAARTGTPILLTGSGELSPATAAVIDELGITSTVVVGGEAAVGSSVAAALPAAERVAGTDRYATAAEVLAHARARGVGFGTVVLATGADFPDGLTAGAGAAAVDGVVVLVDGLAVGNPGPAFDVARSQRASVERLVVLGGRAVVADGVPDRLR